MHLIQFVHRYPPALGGAEAYAAKLTGYCRANGDRVDVWTTSAVQLEEFWKPGAAPASRRPGLWRYQPLSFPFRRYILKALTMLPSRKLQAFALPCNPISLAMWRDAGDYDGPVDAVHATAFPYAWPILCARKLARRRKVPFLLTPFLHLGDERTRRQYTQPALRWILLDADIVFVQTKRERDACLELGVRPERLVLQGLGVESSDCTGGSRQRFREQHGIAGDEIVIGHLANLSVEKGSVDLLEAVQTLNARTIFAGPSMPNFRRAGRCSERPARPIGPLSDSDKKDFFAAIDIFALPSRSDSFGLVLLEAWANGVPCVAYDAGGPGEIIRHGVDGLLARDVTSLKACLQSLIDNPEMRQRLGAAGRKRLPAEFDWDSKLSLWRRVASAAQGRGVGDAQMLVNFPSGVAAVERVKVDPAHLMVE